MVILYTCFFGYKSTFPFLLLWGVRVGTRIPARGIRRSHQGALQIAGREDQGTKFDGFQSG